MERRWCRALLQAIHVVISQDKVPQQGRLTAEICQAPAPLCRKNTIPIGSRKRFLPTETSHFSVTYQIKEPLTFSSSLEISQIIHHLTLTSYLTKVRLCSNLVIYLEYK
jgi:hypothetical protein